MTYYTSRSQIVTTRRCNRAGYYAYHYPNGTPDAGIRKAWKSVPLLTGTAVHHGFDVLLSTDSPDEAISAIRTSYDLELDKTPMDLKESEDAEYVRKEQLALGEAFIWLAHFRIVPHLKRVGYRVVWTEKELQAEMLPVPKGTNRLILTGRPDALLAADGNREEGLEEPMGEKYLLSLKTKGKWNEWEKKRTLEDAEHDDQGLSETWLAEQNGISVDGVLMCWLIKGEHKEQPKGSGRYITSSPLIHGYRKFDKAGRANYAWSYYWDDEEGGHALGKTWVKFDVWERAGGIKEWVTLLHEGKIQPEAGDCLDKQWCMPAPYYRNPRHIEDWVRFSTAQEKLMILRRGKGDLDHAELYPQNLSACSYPGRCEYYDLCWGPDHMTRSPMEEGFIAREPHHKLIQLED